LSSSRPTSAVTETEPRQFSTYRRLSAEEVVFAWRERAGVELVPGFARVVSGNSAISYGRRGPIAAGTHLVDAHLVPLREGAQLTWETAQVPSDTGRRRVVFVFPMAMGNGSPLPQPGGNFVLYLDDRRVLRFTLTKDSHTWEGAGCRLRFDVRRVDATAFGQRLTLDRLLEAESVFCDGMAFLSVAPELVTEGGPVHLRVVAEPSETSSGWFRLGESLFPLLTDHLDPGLTDVLSDRPVRRVGGRVALTADLHSHSAESIRLDHDGCGSGTRDEMFQFARDVAGLDVFSLSEHDWQLGPADWEALGELNEKYDDPGQFVTIPSFEWTSGSYGHRNVYYRDGGAAMLHSVREGAARNTIEDGAPTPLALWDFLDTQGVPAISVPHHMSVAWFPLSIQQFHDPRYDRVAEIYSAWGDSLEHGQPVTMYADRVPELAFIRAIQAGYRVGFIASSDAHDGRPGASQGSASHPHLFHHLGSGRAVILADSFDRHSVFDALRARRCYAVTGPRFDLGFSLSGHPMGSEVPVKMAGDHPGFDIDIATAVPIDRIEIFRDGARCDLVHSGRREEQFRWIDDTDETGSSYFVKVTRTDHESAWTSPIWIDR
jgi:hypothetical protein